jgi:integrase
VLLATCRIKGAGEEKSPERPVLPLGQVFVLADAFADRRYRLLILLAVFCSLRWAELAALRRKHIDLSAGLVRVEVSVVELTNGALVTGPPKSASGVRWVNIPPFLLADVAEHLEQFTGTADDQLVFTGPKGAQLRRSNFTRQWRKALEAAGLTGIHIHDLRHTGNTLAGDAGGSLRELMDRMGHSTTRAALIYQHRTSLRDKMIADEISRRAEAERPQSGTQRARDNMAEIIAVREGGHDSARSAESNRTLLGYEQYDVRLRRLGLSPVVALTCWCARWPSSASPPISERLVHKSVHKYGR